MHSSTIRPLFNRRLALVLCAGLLISLALFFSLKQWEEGRRARLIEFNATDHTNAIQQSLADLEEDILLARNLIEYTIDIHHADPKRPVEFIHLANKTLSHLDGLNSLLWTIRRSDAAGRASLVPLYRHQFAPEGGQLRQHNHRIDQALASPALLHPHSLIEVAALPSQLNGRDTMVISAPVSSRLQQHAPFSGAHIGALIVTVNFQQFIEHAISATPVGELDIRIQPQQSDNPEQKDGPEQKEKALIYNHPSRSRTAADKDRHTGIIITKRVHFAGRQWQIAYEVAPKFLAEHPVVLAWQTLLLSLLLTLLLARYLYLAEKKRLKGQQQFDEQKQQAAAAERKLAQLMEGLNSAYFHVNLAGVITDCSPSITELIGYTPQQMIGTRMIDYCCDKKAFEGMLASLQQNPDGKVLDYEVPARHQDGRTVWTSCAFQFSHDTTGKVNGFEGFVRDIHARKQDEKQKQEFELRLQQTQRLESLGVLAGGIAHDFNNILASIMGNASLASRKIDRQPEAGKQHLAEILNAAKQAARLCQQMLAYAGKGQFIIEPVNVSQLIQDVAELLHATLKSNVRWRYQLQDPLPCIDADKTQIEQIVMNLVTNASESISGEGEITICTGLRQLNPDATTTCRLACDHPIEGPFVCHFCSRQQDRSGCDRPKAGAYVYLSVADTGCGMDQSTIDKIFEPFFTTKFTGRGLGMSAVLGIVKRHHGVLQCESKPGEGTTITILLPVSEKQPALTPAPALAAPAAPEASPAATGLALVIDDELPIRIIAQGMLENLGWKALCADGGAAGIELFRRRKREIDVVLLDMTMPDMDGLAAFDAIRAISPDARIIISSGYSEQEAGHHFADRDIAGFLQKPYELEQLGEILISTRTPA